MKSIEIRPLAIPDGKIVRYARFGDERGYFTETYRKSDFFGHADAACFQGIEFKQANESRSRAGVIRGLHFQWNPTQGKLVRTIAGHMMDLASARPRSARLLPTICLPRRMPRSETGFGFRPASRMGPAWWPIRRSSIFARPNGRLEMKLAFRPPQPIWIGRCAMRR
jgi:hypothetical protein